MRAGSLNTRVTLERPTTIDSDYGGQPGPWLPVATRIAANVQDVLPSKAEATRNGIRIATQSTRIRIRYRKGVTSDMRVIIHGDVDRICQIVSGPAELGRHEGLEMMVETYSS